MDSILEARNLRCERDDRVLFEGLNFSLQAGEILQVEGPNGSGKTSLLRILCGLNRDYSGEIFWQGNAIKQVYEEFFSTLLFHSHAYGIKESLTAQENLQWSMSLQAEPDMIKINTALKRIGLLGFEDVPCYSLSAGQKRRVALARLYLLELPLWILDEPFTAIDKQGIADLEETIYQHSAQGGAVIITTHHAFDMGRVELQRLKLGGAV